MIEQERAQDGARARRAAPFFLALALALALAGCGGGAPQTFDLSAAPAKAARPLRAQLSIREPIASLDLDGQRILVRTGPETIAYLADAQWADRLPTLIQTRLVETFQNAKLMRSVARAGSGPSAEYSLELDIRAFELDVSKSEAVVDFAVKIVSQTSGKVAAARIFRVTAPAAGTSGAAATAALNTALSDAMTQIVAFTAAEI